MADDFSKLSGTVGNKRCKTCGQTANEFERTLLLGCPDCYVNLADEILSFVKRTQGGVVHVGRQAYRAEAPGLAELRNAYAAAIRTKRLDDAERIAANIRALGGKP